MPKSLWPNKRPPVITRLSASGASQSPSYNIKEPRQRISWSGDAFRIGSANTVLDQTKSMANTTIKVFLMHIPPNSNQLFCILYHSLYDKMCSSWICLLSNTNIFGIGYYKLNMCHQTIWCVADCYRWCGSDVGRLALSRKVASRISPYLLRRRLLEAKSRE